MRLSTDLFNALVNTLTPLLRTEGERERRLDAAFYGEATLYVGLDPHAESPRQYAWKLLRFLADRSAGAGWALRRYVETVWQEAVEDGRGDLAEALATLVQQLQGYEALHQQLRAAGLDPAQATPDDAIRLYLSDLRLGAAEAARQYVELAGVQQRRGPAPTSRWEGWSNSLTAWGISLVELDGTHCQTDATPATPVVSVREALLAVERGVLLGEPGSGKTFTLLRLALDYAAVWHGERPDAVVGRAARVPVLVRLRDFNGRDAAGRPLAFATFARAHLGPLAPFEGLLQGRLVWLLDALNEMPRGAGGRDLVREVRTFLRGQPAFVVSCRVRDYQSDLDALRPLEQMQLHELTPLQIHELVTRRLADGDALWRAMGGSDKLLEWWEYVNKQGQTVQFWEPQHQWDWELREDRWNDWQAWRGMHQQPARLIPLCRNPFMAFLVCELYRLGQGKLPASRADLFRQVVQVLLRREAVAAVQRGEAWPEDAAVEAALVCVAGAMQQAGGTVLARVAALGVIPEPNAGRQLDAALAANLLAEEGDAARSVRFSHQLIQEYFAARILLEAMERWERGNGGKGEQGDEEGGSPVLPLGNAGQFFEGAWWKAGVWRETVVILGEFLGEGVRGPNRVARWLAGASPEVALEVILRNGVGLTLADVEAATRTALVASATAKTEESDPRGRAAAYRVLGTFGADARPGIGVGVDGLPDIAWVELPGGTFPIGGDAKAYDRLRAQEVELSTLWMAKYPITNAQWQAFVDDPEGYRVERWWREAGVPQETPDSPSWDYGNHPRETVNWYEAMAYCRWLSYKLGYEVRLPTEAEWERAARGRESWVYPWGDEWDAQKANTDEGGIGQTSAVGMYPQGATPEGLCDLAGNVWEWTASLWGKGQVDITAPRVLRGGSWLNYPQDARAASRFFKDPRARSWFGGFRLVALAPAVDALDSGTLDSDL